MENTTINQRDSLQALQWATITALTTALLTFAALIVIETILFKALNVIDTEANNIQLFSMYLSHASHISFLKFTGINNLSLSNLNNILQGNNTIKIGEYIIYILALIPAIFAYIGEYKNMMVNTRFIKGSQYFQGEEAVKKLTAYIGKVEPDAVKIAGIPISHDRTTKHFMVQGKTGSGKTVCILPILKAAIKRGDKCIAFDNKTDITKFLLDENNNCPIIIAPWDLRSYAIDIGRDCRTVAEAYELSKMFIGESSDPMWCEGGRATFTGFAHKLQVDKQENWNWRDLADLIANTSMDEVEAIMDKYFPEGKRAVESLKNSNGESEGAGKTTQSILITLSAQLSPVFRMAEAWEGVEKKFSVRDYMAGKLDSKVVILQGNAALSGVQNAYIGCLISSIAAYVNSPNMDNQGPEKPGLWLFFDEFPQLGAEIGKKIMPLLEIGRSKGIRVVLGFQNISQIKELQGEESAKSLLDIAQSYIFCTSGADAAKWASESVGTQQIEIFKPSTSTSATGGGSSSASWDRQEEAAIKPVDFTAGLGPDKKIGGVRALYWPTGGDIYNLTFPFEDAKELAPNYPIIRPGHVPALWTLPEWDRPTPGQPIKAIQEIERPDGEEKPLTITFKNFRSFFIDDFQAPLGGMAFHVEPKSENTHEDYAGAPNAEEVDDLEDDFDLLGEYD